MNRYMNDEERKGYDAYNQPGHSRYDGDYDYQRGWEEHAREEGRREEERREERREEERAEESRAQRRHDDLREEEEIELARQEYYAQQPEPEPEEPV